MSTESTIKIKYTKLFIDGEWIEAKSGKKFTTYNPATGEPLAEISEAGIMDINSAVAAAHSAFQSNWRDMPSDERGNILYNISQKIELYRDELGLLDTLDAGRPIRDTRTNDVTRAIKTFKYFAGLTDKIRGATIPVQSPFMNYTKKEPYGVIAAIIPWNYPLTNMVTKIAPILACGNTVVLKPAEQTPLSALRLAAICKEAGLPDGVLNVVPGGPEAGAALTKHPDVRKVAFTGSTEVGKKIAENIKYGMKSLTLELGGKTANVIFEDADLEQASDAAVFSVFVNQGQTCTAGTRLLIHESIRDEFIAMIKDKAGRIKVGDPLNHETQVGSLVSKEQYDRVKSYINIGIKEGATLICGGERPESVPEKGYFLQPTIFSNVNSDMQIAQDEIFGPILSVLSFANEDEAVRIANDTLYGLATSVWTRDIKIGHRMADRVESGLVWINTINTLNPASPYGGYKESGTGTEMGMEVVDQYMKTKSVWVNLGDWHSPFSN